MLSKMKNAIKKVARFDQRNVLHKSLGAYIAAKFKLHLIKIISTIDLFKENIFKKNQMSTYQNIFTIFQYVACKIIRLVFICVFWLFFLVSRMLFFYMYAWKLCRYFSFLQSRKKNLLLRCFDSNTNGTRSLGFFFVAWLVQRLTEHKLKKILWTFFRMLTRLITFNLKCFIENKLAQKRK